MITKLKISNFKSHRNTDLSIGALTLLTGINSSGKSSVLQSLLLLRQSFKKGRLSTGLDLNAPLCDIGKGSDALYRLATDEIVSFSLTTDSGSIHDFIFNAKGKYEDTFLPQYQPILLGGDILDLSLFTNKFQYLSAARWAGLNLYPMDSYAVETEKQLSLNYGQGELVAHFLEYYGEHRDFNIKSDSILHPSSPSKKLLDQTIAWEQEISPQVTLKPLKKADKVSIEYGYKGTGHTPPISNLQTKNIGFGISCSLPIIVGLLSAEPGALLLIENPEAHLHPRGQSKLAELIALAAQSGVQIIVETHSDHIINGTLIACKKYELHKNGIDRNNVKLFYFGEKDEKHASTFENIKVLEGGKIDKQPDGFFDQTEKDLTIIMGF